MFLQRRDSAVRIWAPAKVNLYLEVLGRREDGYHELATLIVAISVYDTVEFTWSRSGEIRLWCDHPELSTGPDNLVCRAAELLRRHCGVSHGAEIRLHKRIPMQAGLGGGSSDAAATLAGLNALWQLGCRRAELAELGAQLGSDVPCFFYAPAAWCTGRGERVEPLALVHPLDLVVVCPPVGLSTAEVYRKIALPDSPPEGALLQQVLQTGVFWTYGSEPSSVASAGGNRGECLKQLGRLLHNRLQQPAQDLCPEVQRWYAHLANHHPLGQLMSGSGSAVFALCRDRGEALLLARALHPLLDERSGARVFVVRSCH